MAPPTQQKYSQPSSIARAEEKQAERQRQKAVAKVLSERKFCSWQVLECLEGEFHSTQRPSHQLRGMSRAIPQPKGVIPPSEDRRINHCPLRYTAMSVFPSPS